MKLDKQNALMIIALTDDDRCNNTKCYDCILYKEKVVCTVLERQAKKYIQGCIEAESYKYERTQRDRINHWSNTRLANFLSEQIGCTTCPIEQFCKDHTRIGCSYTWIAYLASEVD